MRHQSISIRASSWLLAAIFTAGWAGLLTLFASSSGPFPGANTVDGDINCLTSGCHSGNPVDRAQGSVSLSGLPTQWTPNATYSIDVLVQRPTARRFGFQLSALLANGKQAGSFTGLQSFISVNTYIGIQYAQHNAAPFATGQFTFHLTWRAPATVSSGPVTFNLAGNAADGNQDNKNDAIYFTTYNVGPITVLPATQPFAFVNFGGASSKTSGEGTTTSVGFARIAPDIGNTTPSGLAIFGVRTNNVLVSEAGVPASPLIRSGRIYLEVSSDAAVNTGIAIANPNNEPAVVSFEGGSGVLTIPANGQVAKFLTEEPFSRSPGIVGAFSFSSNVPVAVIALRGRVNERSEFLTTTLPVVDLSVAPPTGTQYLAHFANGSGWTTQVILVNPTGQALNGTIELYDPTGVAAGSSPFAVTPGGSQKIALSNSGTAASSGTVRVVPANGGTAPVSLAVFSYKPGLITVSEAGVPAARGTAFRMYAESSGSSGTSGNIQTGVAVSNISDTAMSVSFDLFGLDGSAVAVPTALATIPASGQVAKFLGEIFPTLPQPFQGILRVSSGNVDVSVVGLRGRYNERKEFLITTTPPALETATASNVEMAFPHVPNGGGYSTQFILFSGAAGQSSSGLLRFLTQAGAAWNLTLN